MVALTGFHIKKYHTNIIKECVYSLSILILQVNVHLYNYYVRHNSSIYVVLLDASQAFDRVQYVKLFKLLLKRGVCPLLARLLIHMYTNQTLRIKWNNQLSCAFSVSNGVKQGAILSPLLFSVYMDELLLI